MSFLLSKNNGHTKYSMAASLLQDNLI